MKRFLPGKYCRTFVPWRSAQKVTVSALLVLQCISLVLITAPAIKLIDKDSTIQVAVTVGHPVMVVFECLLSIV